MRGSQREEPRISAQAVELILPNHLAIVLRFGEFSALPWQNPRSLRVARKSKASH